MSAERRLARVFAQFHPLEAARALERLPEGQRGKLLAKLPLEAAVALLRQLETSVAATALAERPVAAVAAVLSAMPAQNGARLLERFEPDRRERILASMAKDAAGAARRLLEYPPETAGALMDPRVAAFPVDITVNEARKRAQREPRNLLYYVYVVDRDDRLVGVVNLRELLLASPSVPLASVMQGDVRRLSARESRDEILANPGWRDVHALPVVDRHGVLVGVLRYDTLRRLEADLAVERAPGLLPVGLALGELYWSAATALLLGAFDALRPVVEPPPGENRHGA